MEYSPLNLVHLWVVLLSSVQVHPPRVLVHPLRVKVHQLRVQVDPVKVKVHPVRVQVPPMRVLTRAVCSYQSTLGSLCYKRQERVCLKVGHTEVTEHTVQEVECMYLQ